MAFAHDSMMGRAARTMGNVSASEFVAREFARVGLTPGGENGGWFQIVPLVGSSETAPARNVIGIVRGTDPALAGTYVAVTAHNDHVGVANVGVEHDSLRAYNAIVRPRGADSPNVAPTAEQWTRIRASLDSLRRLRPPRADSIANGADDDGGGTVAMIEIAEAFSRGGVKPRRSILFVSHVAEENGLLGSSWFTDHPTVPLDSIVANLNLDMVGRGAAWDIVGGGPTYLEVIGLRRISRQFGDWVAAANAVQPLPFVFNEEYDAPGHPMQYYCRSDHYSYARYGIPSVLFTRGSHRDYHQVTDEAQYIDYTGLERLARMVFDAARFVAAQDRRPVSDVPKPTDPRGPCRQ